MLLKWLEQQESGWSNQQDALQLRKDWTAESKNEKINEHGIECTVIKEHKQKYRVSKKTLSHSKIWKKNITTNGNYCWLMKEKMEA